MAPFLIGVFIDKVWEVVQNRIRVYYEKLALLINC